MQKHCHDKLTAGADHTDASTLSLPNKVFIYFTVSVISWMIPQIFVGFFSLFFFLLNPPNNYSSLGNFIIKYHWPLFSLNYYWMGLTMDERFGIENGTNCKTSTNRITRNGSELRTTTQPEKTTHTYDIFAVTRREQHTVRFEFVPITVFWTFQSPL